MELNDSEIKGVIKKFIIDSTFMDQNKIKDETLIFKEGIFDSMGLISLITHLESSFGIQTSDTDLLEENFESLNAISAFVKRKLTSK